MSSNDDDEEDYLVQESNICTDMEGKGLAYTILQTPDTIPVNDVGIANMHSNTNTNIIEKI